MARLIHIPLEPWILEALQGNAITLTESTQLAFLQMTMYSLTDEELRQAEIPQIFWAPLERISLFQT